MSVGMMAMPKLMGFLNPLATNTALTSAAIGIAILIAFWAMFSIGMTLSAIFWPISAAFDEKV